ncbi:Hsp70 ATPase ssc1, partial [Tulasnella sp. 403]
MGAQAATYDEPSAHDILVLSSFLYVLNIARWVFDHFTHAGLVGEVLLGIVYGTPVAGILPQEWESTFWEVGYLGLIIIVFEGGLYTQLDTIQQNLILSTIVAVTGVAFPIGLSILLLSVGFGYPYLDGFAGGAALAATSLGTTFSLLSSDSRNTKAIAQHSIDIRHTRIGVVLLSAALIDDIIGLILVSIIPSVTAESGNKQTALVEAVLRPVGVSVGLFLLVGIGPVRMRIVRLVHTVKRHLCRYLGEENATLLVLVAVLSGFVAAAYYAGASMLFGAWIGGALLGSVSQLASQDDDNESRRPRTPDTQTNELTPSLNPFRSTFEKHIASVQNYLLAPLFFASIGTAIPFLGLWKEKVLWRGVVYSLLMVVAKIVVGLWVVVWPVRSKENVNAAQHERDASVTSSAYYPALLLSFAMVSRGEISLIIAQLGGLEGEAYLVV